MGQTPPPTLVHWNLDGTIYQLCSGTSLIHLWNKSVLISEGVLISDVS